MAKKYLYFMLFILGYQVINQKYPFLEQHKARVCMMLK